VVGSFKGHPLNSLGDLWRSVVRRGRRGGATPQPSPATPHSADDAITIIRVS